MKRYIRSYTDVDIDTSMFAGTPFVCDTDTSYYNDFLNTKELAYMQREKNRTGEIVMMSPKEYFSECSKSGFPNGEVDVDHVMQGRRADTTSIDWLTDHLNKGNKFYLPYLDYAAHSQEGLHRMMVVGDAFGWDTKFPVLVVTVYDDAVEHENQVFKQYWSFLNYDFDHICKQAAYVLFDYTALPETNLEEEFMLNDLRDHIIEDAKNYDDGYDIDVEISEIKEQDDYHFVDVYITQFEDYDASDRNDSYRIVLETYMDLHHNSTPQPDNLDDIDSLLDDIDISDFFFKDPDQN